jgi:hypothetical protein
MTLHKILDWDMEEEPFVLIGIHSTVEPYRLAFLINHYLKVCFKRDDRDQDVSLQNYVAQFPVYSYEDREQNAKIFLVANHCLAELKATSSVGSLFENDQSTTVKSTLIKEYRKVDYLIKIEKDAEHYPIKKLLNKLIEIPQIISVYMIDTLTIKTMDHLIFE